MKVRDSCVLELCDKSAPPEEGGLEKRSDEYLIFSRATNEERSEECKRSELLGIIIVVASLLFRLVVPPTGCSQYSLSFLSQL